MLIQLEIIKLNRMFHIVFILTAFIFRHQVEKIINVVDAGGSGTRLNVYKYIDELESTSIECEGMCSRKFAKFEEKISMRGKYL